jgi:hypothetical protein
MANQIHVTKITAALEDLAKAAKSLRAVIEQGLDYNSAISVDWAEVDTDIPGSVTGGVITGKSYTQTDISNAIGSLDAYRTYWNTHGGNLEKLTDPIV